MIDLAIIKTSNVLFFFERHILKTVSVFQEMNSPVQNLISIISKSRFYSFWVVFIFLNFEFDFFQVKL